MKKTITINDFPDNVYVKFDKRGVKELKEKRESVDKWYRIIDNRFFREKGKVRYPSMGQLRKFCRLGNIELEKLKKYMVSFNRAGNSERIKNVFPIEVDYTFGSIIGHLLGDGGIGLGKKGRYRVFYTNKEKRLLDKMDEKMEKKFGDIPARRYKNQDDVTTIVYPSVIGHILKNIGFNASGDNGKIPDIILNSDTKVKEGLISAIFDDEGTVNPTARAIGAPSINRRFLLQIKEILEEFGIASKVIKRREKNKTRGYEGKEAYYLYINGRENFIKFDKHFLFEHKRKNKLLDKLVNQYTIKSKPIGWTRKKILKVLEREEKSTTRDIGEKIGMGYRATKAMLTKLHNEGKVEREDRKRANEPSDWKLS